MKNQHLAIAILIIVALGGCVFVWHAYKQETAISYSQFLGQYGRQIDLPKVDTTGWATYRDEDFGFEFQYPADEWEVYLPEDNRRWMREYVDGMHREEKKPMHWDTTSGLDNGRNVYEPVLCLMEKGAENCDRNAGFLVLTFSLRGPNWGALSGEELVMQEISRTKSHIGEYVTFPKPTYVNVNGLNISVESNKKQDYYKVFVRDGLQLSIYNKVLSRKENVTEEEWEKELRSEMDLLQSVIQTFRLID